MSEIKLEIDQVDSCVEEKLTTITETKVEANNTDTDKPARLKPIKIDDIPNILRDIPHEKDTKDTCLSGESDDELNNQTRECNDQNSDGEEEVSEIQVTNKRKFNENDDYLVGQDGVTLWRKHPCKVGLTHPEIKDDAQNISNPLEAFTKIIDFDIIDQIVIYSNKYIKKQSKQHSDFKNYMPTSRFEVMALFGIFFYIAVKKIKMKEISELWATDGSGIILIRATMCYKRFLFLLKCLKFCDIREEDDNNEPVDKLVQIRSILDLVLINVRKCYNFGESVTIDEIFLPFEGNYSFLKKNQDTSKNGLKIVVCCDSKTFYCGNLEICVNEQLEGPYKYSNSPVDVVGRLMDPFNGPFNVTLKKTLTSTQLADSLLKKDLTSIGLLDIKKNKLPESFLGKNEADSCNFGYLKEKTLLSYTTNENVTEFLITNRSDATTMDENNKPKILNQYNKTKDAVNDLNEILTSYNILNISKRWSFTIFNFLLNLTSVNAQILYLMMKPDQAHLSRKSFLYALSLELMKEHLCTRAKEPCLSSDITLFLMTNYSISNDNDENYEPPSKRRGCCILCGWKRNSSTTIKCSKCCKFTCKRHSESKIVCYNCMEGDYD